MSDVGVLHPVRIRVAQILALGPHTGTQLRQALPDVPYSSLYRHVRWLLEAGVVRVAGERKVRGAVEHTYELDENAVQGAVPDPAALSADDHERAVTAFVTGLMAQAHAYLESEPEDPVTQGLTYVSAHVWVDDEELARLRARLRELIDPLVHTTPGPGRRQITLGVVAIPQPGEPQP
ncbi:helix-turn-helix domain-containing protein [Nonomuraea jiangxiensis]|uniref:Helix-turn-helix domain-containing protein n=1 Tax=Nonomuraea jiangxiensis TaxID=633440 RepID=A0A1G8L9D0_9ACTN|nr:helix-turn-helix domain-containing protein [Nonomuraea jiangxiensis]SDI52232.1 Helix-turn-helix domain-containing protein [Nonomuraea jiangxiensis]